MHVAVKFLNTEAGSGVAANMRQFASEVDIMRACRANNIVNFLGAFFDQAEVGCRYVRYEQIIKANAVQNRKRNSPAHIPCYTCGNSSRSRPLQSEKLEPAWPHLYLP